MTTDTAAARSTSGSSRAITYVWVLLSAITISSWWLAPAHSVTAAVASVPITLIVIALGYIKCRLIIRYFMDVRTAPRWLKLSTDAWLAVLWLAVLGLYLYSTGWTSS